jgi:hypothetical protein
MITIFDKYCLEKYGFIINFANPEIQRCSYCEDTVYLCKDCLDKEASRLIDIANQDRQYAEYLKQLNSQSI